MTTLPNPPGVSGSGPNLGQYDARPHFGRVLLRIVLAVIVVCLVIAAFVYFGRSRPAANGEVARISVFPVHTTIHGGLGTAGMAGQDENYDQILVFALVRVRNLTQSPINIDDLWAVVTLPNGETRRSLASSENDFGRVFAAYPQLTPLRMDPLRRHTIIQPGEGADGLVVFNYPFGRDQWDARKSFEVTVSFANARELILRAPKS